MASPEMAVFWGGAVKRLDGDNGGRLAGGPEGDLIANGHRPRRDRSRHNASVISRLGELVDVLHRHPQWQVVLGRGFFAVVHHFEHGMAFVPGHPIGEGDDILPFPRGDGDEGQWGHLDVGEEGRVFCLDPLKSGFGIVGEVHFVHHDDELFDPEHCGHGAVAAGVFTDPFFGVDDEDGRFGARSSGDHVFKEFDVSRCVDDDVMAFGTFEKTARGIDRNTLVLFVFERIEEEGVFEWLCVPFAIGPDLVQFAIREAIGVGK